MLYCAPLHGEPERTDSFFSFSRKLVPAPLARPPHSFQSFAPPRDVSGLEGVGGVTDLSARRSFMSLVLLVPRAPLESDAPTRPAGPCRSPSAGIRP